MSFNELLDDIFGFSGFRAIYASDQKAARYLANLDKILEQAVEFTKWMDRWARGTPNRALPAVKRNLAKRAEGLPLDPLIMQILE